MLYQGMGQDIAKHDGGIAGKGATWATDWGRASQIQEH
jgi:hypothetical protein